jgi:hypothetical protein
MLLCGNVAIANAYLASTWAYIGDLTLLVSKSADLTHPGLILGLPR